MFLGEFAFQLYITIFTLIYDHLGGLGPNIDTWIKHYTRKVNGRRRWEAAHWWVNERNHNKLCVHCAYFYVLNSMPRIRIAPAHTHTDSCVHAKVYSNAKSTTSLRGRRRKECKVNVGAVYTTCTVTYGMNNWMNIMRKIIMQSSTFTTSSNGNYAIDGGVTMWQHGMK